MINIEVFNKIEKVIFEYFVRVYEIDMLGNFFLCDCNILFLSCWF